MKREAKLRQGTAAWFDMAGTLLRQAAARAALPATFELSLVERYTDGIELSAGFVQGIRLDIKGGRLSYRVGVRRDERADLTNELTAAAARTLNLLYSTDPAFAATRDHLLATGAMRLEGNFSRLGEWFAAVHDPIVDWTC